MEMRRVLSITLLLAGSLVTSLAILRPAWAGDIDGDSIIYTDEFDCGGALGRSARTSQHTLRTLEPDLPELAVDLKVTNRPIDAQAFEEVLNKVEIGDARAARARLLEALYRAAAAVRAEHLAEAIVELDQADLLDRSGFHPASKRDAMLVPRVYLGEERLVSNVIVRTLRDRPRVGSDGVVVIPLPPRRSMIRINFEWAQRAWIRIAFEELTHVAQVLGVHINPNLRLVSTMFKPERSLMRSLVVQELGRQPQTFDAQGRFIYRPLLLEVDAYAFMIEQLGFKNVPWWYGADSGYGIRRRVDEAFSRRGVPNRVWGVSR